ncbi:MAG: ABC transporter ATP-binding protein, partial [Gemmatimonadetes bacterium]|nr:ABC transporter ATP-binding protein [Gemmatimonadota bacterium]
METTDEPTDGHPLIHLSGLTKVFYTEEVETHALSEIHLDIKAGEFV